MNNGVADVLDAAHRERKNIKAILTVMITDEGPRVMLNKTSIGDLLLMGQIVKNTVNEVFDKTFRTQYQSEFSPNPGHEVVRDDSPSN